MKDIELKLIAELMKNSRRSDRELAKATGVSQPTVSRIIKRLEKEGYLLEYTAIPNFNKIGYHLFALTFFTWKKGISAKEMADARSWALEQAPSVSPNVIVIERGLGLGHDLFMASFHRNYTSYLKLMTELKATPYIEATKMESFIVDLDDKIHYRYLTFSTLAEHLLTMREKNEKKV